MGCSSKCCAPTHVKTCRLSGHLTYVISDSDDSWTRARSTRTARENGTITAASSSSINDGAVAMLFKKTGWAVKDVDLWEANEAFAVVPMALMHELDVSHEIVNVHGGACALGHPIGASGARIMVTLIHALKARGKKRGVATLCIGGGEGTAVALERC